MRTSPSLCRHGFLVRCLLFILGWALVLPGTEAWSARRRTSSSSSSTFPSPRWTFHRQRRHCGTRRLSFMIGDWFTSSASSLVETTTASLEESTSSSTKHENETISDTSTTGTITTTRTMTTTTATITTPKLILLIPAYNEEHRIKSTLRSYRKFLIQSGYTCQILVVDDGSTDQTSQVVEGIRCYSDSDSHNSTTSHSHQKRSRDQCPIQCLSLPQNLGKGGALAAGIQYAAEQCAKKDWNSTLVLTQDADGSGDLAYLDRMIDCMKELLLKAARSIEEEPPVLSSSRPSKNTMDWSKRAIVIGNRNYKLWSPRGITRWGFQTCVKWIMNDLRVQDSQCGYKLMTLNTAKDLYEELQVKGWAHDVEILYRAKLVNIPIQEISVNWEDKDGSKVVQTGVAKVSTQMLLDVIKIRWLYSNFCAWLSLGDF